MTAIVDYGAGNLTSVRLAFAALGHEARVTSSVNDIEEADRIVFPGVGAAKSAMENLVRLGLVDALKKAAGEKPFLGICLGMQILFDRTEEDGGVDCLGLVPGQVRRFPAAGGCKIPQIGWNDVHEAASGNMVPGLGEYYYFVHSYYAEKGPCTAGVTEYAGVEFTSIVQKDGIFACQFHPEKSGAAGLELLKGWLERC
ncbi:MAG: imidazole glycerol phosphate synthase subunit HisH [Kiritimatiellae bacterium]|nr:imidazole glycerol phosphate synthase subunit HisH [Kiritimatiellia bacterium]